MMFKNIFEVTEDGIVVKKPIDSNYYEYQMLIPKEIFIEAYNKYIKEAADDRHSSSDS